MVLKSAACTSTPSTSERGRNSRSAWPTLSPSASALTACFDALTNCVALVGRLSGALLLDRELLGRVAVISRSRAATAASARCSARGHRLYPPSAGARQRVFDPTFH